MAYKSIKTFALSIFFILQSRKKKVVCSIYPKKNYLLAKNISATYFCQ